MNLVSSAEEAQKTLEESMAMSIDERQELALELYRSRHGLSSTTALNPTGTIGRSKNGTTSKKSGTTSATLGKSPPRPSPGELVKWFFYEKVLKLHFLQRQLLITATKKVSSAMTRIPTTAA